MLEAFLAEVRECTNDRDFWPVHTRAETEMTPADVEALHGLAGVLPRTSAIWIRKLAKKSRAPEDAPERFRSSSIDPAVTLYGDPDRPRSQKRLIIGFCGHANRLMMPMPKFLQSVPSLDFDVAVLKDATFAHFLNGIPPGSHSFLDLLRWLDAKLRFDAYRGLYCYGTSGGGFAALRAGMLLQARRAISIGGRWPWHIGRFLHKVPSLPAFDPLCGCVPRLTGKMVCAYSGTSAMDRKHALQLAHIHPVEHFVFPTGEGHNAFAGLGPSEIRNFHAMMFDFEPPARGQFRYEIATPA